MSFVEVLFNKTQGAYSAGHVYTLTEKDALTYLDTGNAIKTPAQVLRESKKAIRAEIIEEKSTPETFVELQNETLQLLARGSTEAKAQAQELIVHYFEKQNHLVAPRQDDEYPLYWYNKENGIYENNGRARAKEFIEELLGKAYSTTFANQIIERLCIRHFEDEAEYRKISDPMKIVVANGVLNLRTKHLEAFSPYPREFARIPVTYDPQASGKKVLEFFNSCGLSHTDTKTLLQWAAYCLIRDYRISRMLFLTGGGRNGKDVTVSLFIKLLGEENVSHLAIKNLKATFSKANLFGKLLNCSTETPSEAFEGDTLKELTGETSLECDRKFLTTIKFVNYSKQLFACNELPESKDQTYAMFSRILLITFAKRFVTKEELDKVPDNEKHLYGLKDSNLKNTLSSKENLSGLLNLALAELDELLAKQDFACAIDADQLKQLWNRRAADIKSFFEEHVDIDPMGAVSTRKETIYEAYSLYCANTLQVAPKNSVWFWRQAKKDFALMEIQVTDNNERHRAIQGCTLRVAQKEVFT